MKRFLLILGFVFAGTLGLFAQDDDDGSEGNEKIRDKMNEYIQKRLNLSNDEAKKFTPVFLRYFKEWKETIRTNKDDKLVRQQKVIDLRLRYRPQFQEIVGEQRGNQVYHHQDVFIRELMDIRKNRMQNGPNKVRRVNMLR